MGRKVTEEEARDFVSINEAIRVLEWCRDNGAGEHIMSLRSRHWRGFIDRIENDRRERGTVTLVDEWGRIHEVDIARVLAKFTPGDNERPARKDGD